MEKFLVASLFLALPGVTQVRFDLENQSYPLLPSFFEPVTKRFLGFQAAYPVLPCLEVQGSVSRNLPYWDGPYNDVSNYHSATWLFRAAAEYKVLQAGPAGLHLGAGILRMTSSWESDDHSYEDPDEPREFWSGSFSHWALEASPRISLFREDQEVDWSLSLSFPMYVGFATRHRKGDDPLAQKGGDLSERFREEYVKDAGLGIRLAVGLAFGN